MTDVRQKIDLLQKTKQKFRNLMLGTAIVGTLGGASAAFIRYEENRKKIDFELSLRDAMDGKNAGRFDELVDSIFVEEGGFEFRKHRIDTPTKKGIQQKSAENFRAKNPEMAKKFWFPKHVLFWNHEQIKLAYRVDYYDHYKINEIKNKSVSHMMFDALVNCRYESVRNFAKDAICEVMNKHAQDTASRPRDWKKEVIPYINSLKNKDLELFYNKFTQSRINFVNEQTKASVIVKDGNAIVRKTNYGGLRKRAEKFVGRFEPTKTCATQMSKKSFSR